VSESGTDVPVQAFHVLIPDARDAKVLLRVTREGWALPMVEVPTEQPWWRVVGEIHEAVLRSLKLDGTVLRSIEAQDPFDPASYVCVFVIEPRQLSWARPSGTDWFGPEELLELDDVHPRHAELIERYFTEELPEHSPPWTRPGWLGRAVSWLEDEFERVGLRAVGRMYPVTASSQNATARIPLDSGAAYLKACGEASAHEPELTAYLARECPRLIPRVFAIDAKRGYLLTEDSGVCSPIDLQHAQWLLRGLAEVQMQTAEHPDKLIELGCPDQRPEILRADLDRFVHALSQCVDGGAFFTELDSVGLRKHLDSFEEAFAELAEADVPASLHLPQFGPESVVQQAGESRIIGWSGALSHPFLTPLRLVDGFESPEERMGLEALYLQHWLDFADLDRLEELFQRARMIAPLYRAMETLRRAPLARTLGERREVLAQLRRQLEALCASAPEEICPASG